MTLTAAERVLFLPLLLTTTTMVAVCSGQMANLTLIEITPCNGTVVQTVSRFKSDIFAVRAVFSACPPNDTTFLAANGKLGLRVVSWSNVSLDQKPVIFINRQDNAGVTSWNIPLQPKGFDIHFHHVNRTVCPSNITSQDTAGLEELDEYLFYVDVFSSSEVNLTYSLAVETVPYFNLEMGESLTFSVGASSPQIRYFKFPENVSVVTVEVTTDSDRCAFVSVQNNTCPINDLLENARSRGLYQTMSKTAFLTVQKKNVLNDEFVLVIITTDYTICHGSQYEKMEPILPSNNSNDDTLFAQNITVTVKELQPISKFVVAILFPFFVFLLYLAIVCLYIFALPRCFLHLKPSEEHKYCCKYFNCMLPWSEKCYPSTHSTYCALEGNNGSSADSSKGTKEGGEGVSTANIASTNTTSTTTSMETPLEDSIRSIHLPEGKLMLPVMCTQKFKKLDKQYAIYSWNTLTVGIFYALPAFQLVLSEQQVLNTSGDQDKCYFNFKCAHPLGVLSAFNNFWSNVGYFLLGLLFWILVTARKMIYSHHRRTNKQHVDSHGLPEFYGIYQAMGTALILEGFMSAFYHICPTDANFQFDTAFMFIIGGLFLVKLFQNRHPDINANAFIAFFSFAVIIFITLIGIYLDRGNPVAIRLTIFILVIILISIFFFSFYRFHSWKCDCTLEALREELNHVKAFFTRGPLHKGRFMKLLIVFVVNILLMVLVVVFYKKVDIATSILAFFIVNLMLFLLIYLAQKLLYRETVTLLPMFLAVCSVSFWGSAFYFFIIRATTNWQFTPAESRDMNSPCVLLGFYDPHDVWHFLSASAMFFSFLFLLTLDDGLRNTKRDDIHIF